VKVIRVVDGQYLNFDLDYLDEVEVIESLGEVMNNFNLWHRRDITIHEKVVVVITTRLFLYHLRLRLLRQMRMRFLVMTTHLFLHHSFASASDT
jgi:hypothetical protein